MINSDKHKENLRREIENAYGLIHNIDALAALKEGDLLFIDRGARRKPNEKDVGHIGYVLDVYDEADDRWGAKSIPLVLKPKCYTILFDGNSSEYRDTATRMNVFGDSVLFVGIEAVDKQLKSYNTSIEDFLKLK